MPASHRLRELGRGVCGGRAIDQAAEDFLERDLRGRALQDPAATVQHGGHTQREPVAAVDGADAKRARLAVATFLLDFNQTAVRRALPSPVEHRSAVRDAMHDVVVPSPPLAYLVEGPAGDHRAAVD